MSTRKGRCSIPTENLGLLEVWCYNFHKPDDFSSATVDLRFGVPVIEGNITSSLGPEILSTLDHHAVTIRFTFSVLHNCKVNSREQRVKPDLHGVDWIVSIARVVSK